MTRDEDVAEDRELLRRIATGDESARSTLVERHLGTVYRYLLTRTGDEDQAADLTQETFLKALNHLSSFRGEAGFRTWILSIATNEMRRSWVRPSRKREVELDQVLHLSDPEAAPDRDALQALEMERVRRALERLPEKQRLSVSLRIFDGLSYREVGRVTGSSEGAARVNFFHGIRRLREVLDDG